jgi:DNA replication protein
MISIQHCVQLMNKGNTSIPLFLLENYKKIGLTDEEVMLILHIHAFANDGIPFPSIEQLQERMTCSTKVLSQLLNRLHKEKYLDLTPSMDKEGMMDEEYSLEPLWIKLFTYLSIEMNQQEVAVTTDTADWPPDAQGEGNLMQLEGEVFRRFEQEFGRPLSPIECETITLWLDNDQYNPQVIFLALKEAVISSKLSLRYIDRILFEWQKNGLKNPEDIREHSKKFRQQQQPVKTRETEQAKAKSDFSFYNWLEK